MHVEPWEIEKCVLKIKMSPPFDLSYLFHGGRERVRRWGGCIHVMFVNPKHMGGENTPIVIMRGVCLYLLVNTCFVSFLLKLVMNQRQYQKRRYFLL